MTTVNNDEQINSISGFPPHTSRFLLTDPTTRPLFTSIIIILKVYPVLLLIFGSLGNLLSFCVLLRANMRRYSTFCYLACLALVDLGVIITFCINLIPLYHFNTDIQNIPFACKLFAFSIYFLPQYSSWILVAVSIDRVISAKYLRLAKTWSKPKHSVLVALLLGLILAILNSHFFLYENNSIKQENIQINRTTISDKLISEHINDFSFINSLSNDVVISGSSVSYQLYTPQMIYTDTTLQQQYENGITVPNNIIPSFDVNIIHCSLENSREYASLHVYWIWTDLLMNVFLPFTAMIACTIIIILTLVRSSSRSGSTSARRSRRRRNISVMLITINLVFISLTAPIVIFLSIYPYIKDESNSYRQLVLILIKILCIILMNLNHSVNIIVYSVTGKEFRVEMMNFFHAVVYCIIGKPIDQNDIQYINNDERIFSCTRRLRNNLLKCCRRVKMRTNSTNTNDSNCLQRTTTFGNNYRSSKTDITYENQLNQRKQIHRNGKKKKLPVRYSETSTTHRSSHRLTVQLQALTTSSESERENVSLHRLSNSTDD